MTAKCSNQDPHDPVVTDADILLTVREVQNILRISNPTFCRLRVDTKANFPKAILVTDRAFCWRKSEVEAWFERRETD